MSTVSHTQHPSFPWIGHKLRQNKLNSTGLPPVLIMVSSYIAHIQCSARFTHIRPTRGHWTWSFMCHFNSLFRSIQHLQPFRHQELIAQIAISVLPGTHQSQVQHLRVNRLSDLPKDTTSNNVPIMRGEKQISLKILHQVGFETARQAATLAKLRALAIAPRPSLCVLKPFLGLQSQLQSSWCDF